MRTQRWIVAPLVAVATLGGCAHTRYYSDAELRHPTGVRFYSPKPYLLVARNGAPEAPVQVSIIYLPDLANPQYARPKGGLGKSKLEMKLEGGMLTTLGQESDPGVGATLTAIGSLTGALGKAFESVQKGLALREESGARPIEEGARLVAIADDIVARVVVEEFSFLSTGTVAAAEAVARRLTAVAQRLLQPRPEPDLAAEAGALEEVIKSLQGLRTNRSAGQAGNRYNLLIDQWSIEIAAVIEQLVLPAHDAPPPTFELYEIRQGAGGVTLVPVSIAAPGDPVSGLEPASR